MAVTWKEILKGAISTGSSTGTSSQQSIAHGLGTTPNLVSIVPTASGADTVSLDYADSTYIYVTVTSGKTYNWLAAKI